MRIFFSVLVLSGFIFSSAAHSANEALLKQIVQGAIESESDSLVILENGKLVYSDFFGGRDELRSVQSITKSLCALAIGILVEEGKIASLDLPLSTWVPLLKQDPQKAKITLRMILNHTSGYPDVDSVPGFWKQDDIVAAAAEVPLTAEPGERFLYSSIAVSLLQPVIAQASGVSVTEYVKTKLFDPMLIQEFSWKKDGVGQERTSGGLFLSTRDLVKIGELLLAEGRWEKRGLFWPETLRGLVAPSQAFFPYGLLFWLDKSKNGMELFSAVGWGGQLITVFPEKKLIAVRTKDPRTVTESKREQQSFRGFRQLIANWE